MLISFVSTIRMNMTDYLYIYNFHSWQTSEKTFIFSFEFDKMEKKQFDRIKLRAIKITSIIGVYS